MRQPSIQEFFPLMKKASQSSLSQSSFLHIRDENFFTFIAQPFLQRHLRCNDHCLAFQTQRVGEQNHDIQQLNRTETTLPLDECAIFLEQIVNERMRIKKERQVQKKVKTIKKKTQFRAQPLSLEQRLEIKNLQVQGFKNAVIAAILNVTPGQVRMNQKILKQEKCSNEIRLSEAEKQWLLKQCSLSTNDALFNAQTLLTKFKQTFKNYSYSLYQFRKLLHSLNIRYRIPSLKPLCYFQKGNRNTEVDQFIEQLCGYLLKGYKMIFIDESSLGRFTRGNHRQWHLLGSFKQSLERVGSLNFIIAAMGEEDFLCFQVIQGTGKGYIFRNFMINLIKEAKNHYAAKKFVFILDNATIHKGELMQDLLNSIHHVFTPPYRPDMNGIEHLFAWLKREVFKQQPFLNTRFHFSIHQSFSLITKDLIHGWCNSIFKHMLNEISYLLS